MIKTDKLDGRALRGLLIGLGIVVCLGAVGYSFFIIQQESGQEGEHRQVAEELGDLARQVADSARETEQGREEYFADLARQVEAFDAQLARIRVPELSDQVSLVDISWQPIRRDAEVLVETGPRLVFLRGVSSELQKNLKPMQREFTRVVEVLQQQRVSSQTLVAAQKAPWLAERIARNIDLVLMGGRGTQEAADEVRSDTTDFIRTVEALTRGDQLMGIDKISNTSAIDSLSDAFRMFSVVSTSVDKIAGAAEDVRKANASRRAIAESSVALNDAIAALSPAIDQLAVGKLYDSGNLLVLFVAPGVLAIGLLVAMYGGQRRRESYTAQGVASIDAALGKISEGNLATLVPEDNVVTADIAKGINSATQRQCELIRNIRTPFETSVDEINAIGVTSREQVDKCRELTDLVVVSSDTATEMVRTSDDIKKSTAEAARTSDRNCEQVAHGYELTKNMSKASANVRESVQETSKSAKRQGELIQSVTAAAEYIQALNTKISVVAINTRIEAEKAGEYGRPFLGIAESIADLLREAEEEGRKIISEVRMLQNMSADNLASMENTVGTVVTILEHIERLDSSLEEINAGSDAISSIIRSVDDAAGQSAAGALKMSSSMADIRDRNAEISKLSESSQSGVTGLQQVMRIASQNLAQFRLEGDPTFQSSSVAELEELENIRAATQVYREDEMNVLETAEPRKASV